MCVIEAVPECTKPGFWKGISSPACAVLYEEEGCQGDSTELFVRSATNGTARSATMRPGCYLYEGDKDLGLDDVPIDENGRYLKHIGLPTRKQYWTSSDNQSHEVSCRCFSNNADALTCTPSEEWILMAAHDNRKYSVASLFEYKFTGGYVLGSNGKAVHVKRKEQFHDIVRLHGLKTFDRWDAGHHAHKTIVPAKSCAFVLQEAYKCASFFYVLSKVEVRVQDSASTNGGTQPCNLDYATAVPTEDP
ncbi:hypothetical protein AAVH_37482 [Aphelenchoides avenae]|nr:hypothetical protein AAVH_37482 [Aphelenchus avenae]